VIVRAATPSDYAAIRTVVLDAFGGPDEADLVEALRESGDAVIETVAAIDGGVVGHILISKLQAPDRCLALAPVSVRPAFQKHGVGSGLIRSALDEAKKADWQAMFLLGDPDYYTRFGFDVGRAAKFETAYPKAYFMALELRSGALEKLIGDVVFAAPFQALDHPDG
jgi:putative acetyltransferase